MKIKPGILIYSWIVLILNLVISAVFNLAFSNPLKIYSNIIEPMFFAVATFLLFRKWKLKGLISILIIYIIPFIVLFIVSGFENGVAALQTIVIKPIIYQVRLYSLFGILLGVITGLILNRTSDIKQNEKGIS